MYSYCEKHKLFQVYYVVLKFLINDNVNETFMKIIFYSFYALILRIGSLIILPIVLIIIIININKIIKIFFNYIKLNFFIIFFLSIFLFKNFILTGCLAYPLYWTCTDNKNITWAIINHLIIKFCSICQFIY